MKIHSLGFAVLCLLVGLVPHASAQGGKQSFLDIPPSHPLYDSVEYLKGKNLISGYENQTFRPENQVNRAEAVKILLQSLVSQRELDGVNSTAFSDVPDDAWFLPYAELGRERFKIVDGPPKTTKFNPEMPVKKVEFIKMLLLAYKIDPNSYGEINLALSKDITNPKEWYYPYFRYAVSSALLTVSKDGFYHPGKELTRADVALIMHRFFLYRSAERTQTLLSNAEMEILATFKALERNDVTNAEYTSARALLAARGALASQPNEALVKGVVKVTESFRALVRAYSAWLNKDYDSVITLSKDAWFIADQAKKMHEHFALMSGQIQTIAANLADSARKAK